MLNHITLREHDQIRFGLMPGRWDIAGDTSDGRYVLALNSYLDTYQVIDREQGFRGALVGGPMVNPSDADAPRFKYASVEDHALHILNALEDGQELALASLMPLWITDHWTGQIRGPVLDLDKLSDWAGHQVWHWMQANGCRWLIGSSAIVRIRGKHIEVDSWTIRNRHQAKTLWPRRIRGNGFEPYQKRRRLRIRVPLSTIRKA